MATFPESNPTNSVTALSDLINKLVAAGFTPDPGLDHFGIVVAAVRNLITSQPSTQLPTSDALTAAGAASIATRVTTLVGPAASTYAITLAAPTTGVAGLIKEITMISTTATNAVTLALTNVVGGSSATSASFDAAGETLVLISNAVGKWVVFKEYGVTLS